MMRLTHCKCGERYYVRIPRRWWMRLFAGYRLYYGCTGCGVSLFIRPVHGEWDPNATTRNAHAPAQQPPGRG